MVRRCFCDLLIGHHEAEESSGRESLHIDLDIAVIPFTVELNEVPVVDTQSGNSLSHDKVVLDSGNVEHSFAGTCSSVAGSSLLGKSADSCFSPSLIRRSTGREVNMMIYPVIDIHRLYHVGILGLGDLGKLCFRESESFIKILLVGRNTAVICSVNGNG